MKVCSKCGIEKSNEYFYARKDSPDGRRKDCKQCSDSRKKEWLADPENIAKRKESLAAWNASNKDRIRDAFRTRYRENPQLRERIRLANCRWIEKNPGRAAERYLINAEKIKKASSARYLEKTEECQARNRLWREKNREKSKAINKINKMRRRAAPGICTQQDIARMRIEQRMQCKYCKACLEPGYHLDHIMPITLGGTNWPENLQLLCPTCNLRKNAKHPEEFERQIGYCRQG